MIKSDLLIHSVRVLSQSGIDRDGNKTTTETVINHVRVEYYNAVTQGTAGAQAADTMVESLTINILITSETHSYTTPTMPFHNTIKALASAPMRPC